MKLEIVMSKDSKKKPTKKAQPDITEPQEVAQETTIHIYRDVFETEQGYFRLPNGKNAEPKRISNVTFTPIAKVVADENDWFFQIEAKTPNNESREITLSRKDFSSAQAFKRALSFHMFEFYGNSNDATQIQGILADQNPPTKKGINRHGLYKIGDNWYYVDSDEVFTIHGQNDDVVAVGNKSDLPQISTILENPDLSNEQLRNIADDLYRFNHESVVFPILGYIGYCFLKPRVQDYVGLRNPFLFFQGEPGSGKSETILRIIYPIFSSLTPLVNIANATEFAGAVECGYSNTFPVAFDEWKTAVVSRQKRAMMELMLLALFNQTSLKRGRGNGSVYHLRYQCPSIIAGEMKIESPSLFQRMVEIFFSINKRKAFKDSYLRLTGMPLGSLGKRLLVHTLSLDDEHLLAQFNLHHSYVDGVIEDRIRDNATLLRMGLWLIIDYLKSNDIDTQNYEHGYEVIDAIFKEMVITSKITNVERTLQDFSTMASLGYLSKDIDYDIKDKTLRLKIAGVYDKFERWNKRNHGTAESIGKHSFFQQLEDKPYYIKKATTRIGNNKPCNAIHIDIKQVPESVDIEHFRDLEKDETFFDEGDEDPWWKGIPECEMPYEQFINGLEGRKVYNKDGTPSLTTLLMDILYCDQRMDLETIVDEVRNRGLRYEEKHAKRIVRLTLRKSKHFEGCDETGYACRDNGRFWRGYY